MASSCSRALAIHEMGHAIVALACGCGVYYAEGDFSSGGVTWHTSPQRDDHQVAVSLAGGPAAKLFGMKSPTTDDDIHYAQAALDRLGWGVPQGEAFARSILQKPAIRRAVEIGAKELEAKVRLEGKRIAEIARQAGVQLEPNVSHQYHRDQGAAYLIPNNQPNNRPGRKWCVDCNGWCCDPNCPLSCCNTHAQNLKHQVSIGEIEDKMPPGYSRAQEETNLPANYNWVGWAALVVIAAVLLLWAANTNVYQPESKDYQQQVEPKKPVKRRARQYED